jgi:predicted methyltransferase
MLQRVLILTVLLALAACQPQSAPSAAAPPTAKPPVVDQPAVPPPPKSAQQLGADTLATVLAGSWRSPENKARDQYRHPSETLTFFGVAPGQTVIEITPGGGWYTEILAPFLKGNGKLIVALSESPKGNDKFRAKLTDNAANFGDVELREFAPKSPSLGPDNSADVVVTFRNVHNFVMSDSAAPMFQAFFKVLKPGGVLGVTDHRANNADLEKTKKNGYIPEDYVIKLATDAGFRLAGKSDVNNNPKDTKDYPEGVWTLPPTLTLKDKDREKYLAIGESDRMTLKFVKPKDDAIFKQPDEKK